VVEVPAPPAIAVPLSSVAVSQAACDGLVTPLRTEACATVSSPISSPTLCEAGMVNCTFNVHHIVFFCYVLVVMTWLQCCCISFKCVLARDRTNYSLYVDDAHC